MKEEKKKIGDTEGMSDEDKEKAEKEADDGIKKMKDILKAIDYAGDLFQDELILKASGDKVVMSVTIKGSWIKNLDNLIPDVKDEEENEDEDENNDE